MWGSLRLAPIIVRGGGVSGSLGSRLVSRILRSVNSLVRRSIAPLRGAHKLLVIGISINFDS